MSTLSASAAVTRLLHTGVFLKTSQLTSLQLDEVEEWDEKITFGF